MSSSLSPPPETPPVDQWGAELWESLSATAGAHPLAQRLGWSVERRAIFLMAPRPEPESLLSPPLPGRRRLLFVGGVHGDEPSSTAALLELVARLEEQGDPEPKGARDRADAARLRQAARCWILPALNPDGLVRNVKNNAHDVDLNRNFPARNFTVAHAPGYFPGARPLSEPESQLLAELVAAERIEAVVAVHAPFACVNYDGPAKEWAAAVSAACGWPVWEAIGYPTPGSLGTWLGVDSHVPVLTLELPQGTLTGFRAAAAVALETAILASPGLPLGNACLPMNIHRIG